MQTYFSLFHDSLRQLISFLFRFVIFPFSCICRFYLLYLFIYEMYVLSQSNWTRSSLYFEVKSSQINTHPIMLRLNPSVSPHPILNISRFWVGTSARASHIWPKKKYITGYPQHVDDTSAQINVRLSKWFHLDVKQNRQENLPSGTPSRSS